MEVPDDMSSDGSVTCIQMYSMYVFHQLLKYVEHGAFPMPWPQWGGQTPSQTVPNVRCPFRGDHHSWLATLEKCIWLMYCKHTLGPVSLSRVLLS